MDSSCDKNAVADQKKDVEQEKESDKYPVEDNSIRSFEELLMFRCPELGDEVLSQRDWKLKFREQLANLKESDDVLAAILSIKSLNPPGEVQQCVGVLEKYMRNLIDYPGVDKYRCIRIGNEIFNEKVLSVEGGLDFLMSIGFKTAVSGKDNKEPYLVYSPTKQIDIESIMKSLRSMTGFELELDRNVKILYPHEVPGREDTTDEFYDWTLKDMKKEQKSREEKEEERQHLRSKSKKRGSATADYSYTRIRVKFPDGVLIETVFSVKEKLCSLKSLLQSKFYFYDDFSFMALPSKVFNVLDEEKTYYELELYPNVTLMLKWAVNSTGEKYTLKTN